MRPRLQCPRLALIVGFVLGFVQLTSAAEKTAAERGQDAARGRPALNSPLVSMKAYENAWKQWGLKEKPTDYPLAFRERYGLHAAPYDNGDLPLGFHEAKGLLGKGISNDCLLCHAGAVAGQTHIGLGNASLDLQTLYEELFAADGIKLAFPFPFGNVRGTIEAEAVVLYLMQFRDADLNLQAQVKLDYRSELCQDIPAWWHLKKKKTMYHNGGVNARSVRSMMPFLLGPLNSGAYIRKQEPVFADIQAYLLTLEPPRYPFAVDEKLAAGGKELFKQHCARCHGTYGPDGAYPNKLVALEVIGTDRTLAEGYSLKSWEHYNKSWFAQEKVSEGDLHRKDGVIGYQAPPLDGVWASAPYFHNGSVPTVYHVLNSKARPKVFTRSYGTGKEDYDPVRLGWKLEVLNKGPDPTLPGIDRRKVYDTTQPGRGNSGHPFGDKLTEEERMAVIEYLKTL